MNTKNHIKDTTQNEKIMRPELLAPAGSFDSLRAAVQNGADAVYLGLQMHNARTSSENFTLESLKDAVYYCHVRGVKVYLALNTLITEDEMNDVVDTAMQCANMGIDGIIIQDLGLAARLVELNCPCELHASTQTTVYNVAGLKTMSRLGFCRCIPARELSLNEIQELCETGIMDIEVFGHGALCMSYSGQCLMSNFIGGRSGNRGQCAQPCRMKYTLKGISGHHLSPSDLCTLPFLEELISTGVKSIKIEGRLRSPEYTATVTKIYRNAIDNIFIGNEPYYTQKDIDDLSVIFTRGDYTSGHMLGKMPSSSITLKFSGRTGVPCGNMIGYAASRKMRNIPMDLYDITARLTSPLQKGDGITFGDTENVFGGSINVISKKSNDTYSLTIAGTIPKNPNLSIFKTYDDVLINEIRKTYEKDKENRKVDIYGNFTVSENEKCKLIIWDDDGNSVESYTSCLPEKSTGKGTSITDLEKQLNKTGNTPFIFDKLTIDISDAFSQSLFLPISAINEVRRETLDKLEKLRGDKINEYTRIINSKNNSFEYDTEHKEMSGVSVFFYDATKFMECYNILSNVSRVYIPIAAFCDKNFVSKIQSAKETFYNGSFPFEIIASMPWINKGNTLDKVPDMIAQAYSYCDGYLAENIGDFYIIKKTISDIIPKKHIIICGDYSLNFYNTDTLNCLNTLGCDTLTISPELGENYTFEKLPEFPQIEAVSYGRIVLMRSEHCPVGTAIGNKAAMKCNECAKNSNFTLKDKKDCEFPVICDPLDCRSVVLSYAPVKLDKKKMAKKAIAIYRINVFDESPEEIEELITRYNTKN